MRILDQRRHRNYPDPLERVVQLSVIGINGFTNPNRQGVEPQQPLVQRDYSLMRLRIQQPPRHCDTSKYESVQTT